VTRLQHLADEICAGAEIYFTGREGGQYYKTAFILCDDYTELASKLYLTERTAGWQDTRTNGSFKSYPEVLGDVARAHAQARQLCTQMIERRRRRNEFFHSANLLDLSITSRMCVEAFCDLFAYCELLFDRAWKDCASAARNLEILELLFRLEQRAYSDPQLQSKVKDLIRHVPRTNFSASRTGIQVAEFPADLHLRLSVINGGSALRDALAGLLAS
jgi:hypothetical protein